MSIIVKPPLLGSGAGGNGKGYPPQQVRNINIVQQTKTHISIQFSDPDDTILENVSFAIWNKTILVRNEDHVPTSSKDGVLIISNTERDKYSNTSFNDTNVVYGKTYYYRFFTYSNKDVENNEFNYKKITFSNIPSFSDATWSTIKNMLYDENIDTRGTWKVGDEKDIELIGRYAQTITVQIWEYNHDTAQDGSSAMITLGMKNLFKDKYSMYAESNPNGYHRSTFRLVILPQIWNCFPDEVKDIMTPALKYSYGCASNASDAYEMYDKLWLPSPVEFTGINYYSNKPLYGNKYEIFTDDNSRIKYLSNGTGGVSSYYTREQSVYMGYYFYSIGTNGRLGIIKDYEYYEDGICLAFCI